MRRSLWIIFFAWLLLAVARIAGPSDIYDKEQPRTIAYTADILEHGHWVLPYDTFGIPATKPPLYNWISVPFVAAFGYQEWALKAPSLLAGLAVAITLYIAARKMFPASEALPLLAPLLYLATPMSVKLMYVARPDMLLTACLAAAWVAGTILAQSPAPRYRAQLAFWIATTLAAFAKGPSALLAIAYLLLAVVFLAPRQEKWRTLLRTGWFWGVPLLLIPVGIVTYLSWQQEPEFFRQVLLGREVAGRVARPGQLFATFFNGPLYVFTRFLPWSIFGLFILAHIAISRWFEFERLEAGLKRMAVKPPPRHALTPAILWLVLILVSFSFMSTKRPDRYAPVMPAVAIISTYGLMHFAQRFKLKTPHLVCAAVAVIIGLIMHNQFFSEPATTHFGDNAVAFAREVRAITQSDPILFTDGELTPVQTLLGHNQPQDLTAEQLGTYKWSIRYHDPKDPNKPLVVSRALAEVNGPQPGELALYALNPAHALPLYRASQLAPKQYSDNATTNAPASPTTRWSQFWRPH